ncbi:MAG: fumarylacetoacetate hydrolase family protein [Rhodothermales bacterium]|nr:fumarylacetoacetate hydrolase family protein [Rhodothermales bacterium]
MKLEIPGISGPVTPGKVLCIGRNYAAHAAEMESAVPEEPMIFLKPSSALTGSGSVVAIPSRSRDVHHEVELVCCIGKNGKNISREAALDHVVAYAVGLDLTARDIQGEAKRKGHPWSVSKGFDTFAPIGGFKESALVGDPSDINIKLYVNDELRQYGNTGSMIFDIPTLVSFCSEIFTLEPGDLIYTGTPEGVGPIRVGDTLRATADELPELVVTVSGQDRDE